MDLQNKAMRFPILLIKALALTLLIHLTFNLIFKWLVIFNNAKIIIYI